MKKLCTLTFVFSIFFNLVLGQWQSVSQLNNGVSTPYVNFLNDQYIKRVGIGVVGLVGQAYSSQNNQTIPDPNFMLDLGNY